MQRIGVCVIFVLGFAISLPALAQQVGSPAPDFTLETFDGRKVTLSDLKGKEVCIMTWASWCPYCIKLEKEVFSESAFDKFAGQNLVLLKLDFGPGGTPSSKKDEALQKEFGVKGFPTYFLTDAAGTKLAQGGYNAGINPEKFGEWVKKSAPKK